MRALDAIRRANRHIILDIDDAIWEWNANSNKRFRHALSHSRLVIVGSQYLARAVDAMPSAPETICVRPAIRVADYSIRSHEDRGSISVGWIGGPAALQDFTPPVVDALRVLANDGTVALSIVCDRPLDSDLPSTYVPWAVDTEAQVVSGFDIGIMPLLDTPGRRGRCGLKAIQYQAAGLPVVAAPIGVGPELVDSSTGFLAELRDDWIATIRELATNAPLRTRLGKTARVRAETEYDVRIAGQRIRDAINTLA